VTLYFDLLKKVIDWAGNLHYSNLLKKAKKDAVPAPKGEAPKEAVPAPTAETDKNTALSKLKDVSDEKEES
jgi:hypothetical protein